jgi:hypothetical protein
MPGVSLSRIFAGKLIGVAPDIACVVLVLA